MLCPDGFCEGGNNLYTKKYLKEIPDGIITRFEDIGKKVSEESLEEILAECKYLIDCWEDIYAEDDWEEKEEFVKMKKSIQNFYKKYKTHV